MAVIKARKWITNFVIDFGCSNVGVARRDRGHGLTIDRRGVLVIIIDTNFIHYRKLSIILNVSKSDKERLIEIIFFTKALIKRVREALSYEKCRNFLQIE